MASTAITVVCPPRVTASVTANVPSGSVSAPAWAESASEPSKNPVCTPENCICTVFAQVFPTVSRDCSPLTLAVIVRDSSAPVTAVPFSVSDNSFRSAPRQRLSVNPVYILSPHCSMPVTDTSRRYCRPLAQE